MESGVRTKSQILRLIVARSLELRLFFFVPNLLGRASVACLITDCQKLCSMDSWQYAPGAVLSNVTRTVWRQTCWTLIIQHGIGPLPWRTLCYEWADATLAAAQEKRQRRKAGPSATGEYECSICGRKFRRTSDCFTHACAHKLIKSVFDGRIH